MSKESPDTEATIEAWFLGDRDVEPADVVELARAVDGDGDLERTFDELALADRLLGGTADEPGELERDFGRALFAGQLDALLASESDDSKADELAEVVPLRRRSRQPVAAYASAAMVLLMAAFAAMNTDRAASLATEKDSEFQARTAAVAGWEPRPDAPKIISFCVERSAGEVSFSGPEQAPFGVVECPADAELKLAVRNSQPTRKWAAFFGVHENGTLLWYGPTPAAPRPVEIGVSDDVQPVGETIRLSVNHEPGAVRVHALFSNQPVDFVQLERWVTTNQSSLFERTMVVEPAIGQTDTQLFEVTP